MSWSDKRYSRRVTVCFDKAEFEAVEAWRKRTGVYLGVSTMSGAVCRLVRTALRDEASGNASDAARAVSDAAGCVRKGGDE